MTISARFLKIAYLLFIFVISLILGNIWAALGLTVIGALDVLLADYLIKTDSS